MFAFWSFENREKSAAQQAEFEAKLRSDLQKYVPGYNADNVVFIDLLEAFTALSTVVVVTTSGGERACARARVCVCACVFLKEGGGCSRRSVNGVVAPFIASVNVNRHQRNLSIGNAADARLHQPC